MRRLTASHLRIIFAIQSLCVAIFIVGTLGLVTGLVPQRGASGITLVIRTVVAIGLFLGTTLGWGALRHSLRRVRETEGKLKIASNAFMDVVAEHFDHWGLTPAERDVALFSLKGMTVNEISELRGTSPGTVKAQTNAIYRKAGVSGRPQFLSLFIDDLILDQLPTQLPPESQPLGPIGQQRPV